MKCPQCQHELRDTARFCDNCGLATAWPNISTLHNVDAVVADPLVGRVLESKYELVAKIGEGGMGSVYRARRIRLAGEVAIKILHRKYVVEDGAVERFRREARAASHFNHPNVVVIHDFGEPHGDDEPAYIVMELVEGESLRDLLRREGRLEPGRAVALMLDVCNGVGAAHRRNIVHRDIKPDNVIVLPPNEDRERELAKVVDFGLAKLRDIAAGNTLTRTGAVLGTPYYMSPEQWREKDLDARADVYSLGAMLYEMLSGTPPFTANSPVELADKHLHEEPPPLPAQHNVAPELGAVCVRSLAKDPQTRQADAAELARELRRAERDAAARRVAEERARQEEEAARRAREEEEAARRAESERRRGEEAARAWSAKQADEELTIQTARIKRPVIHNARVKQPDDEDRTVEASPLPAERSARPTVETRRPEQPRARRPPGPFESFRKWIDGETDGEENSGPVVSRGEAKAPRHQPGRLESIRRWIDGETGPSAQTNAGQPRRSPAPVPAPSRPRLTRGELVITGVSLLAVVGAITVIITLMLDVSKSGVTSNTSMQLLPTPAAVATAAGGDQNPVVAASPDAGAIQVQPLSIIDVSYTVSPDDFLSIRTVIKNAPDALAVELNDREAELEPPRKVSGDQIEVVAKLDFAKEFAQMKNKLNVNRILRIRVSDRANPDNYEHRELTLNPRALRLDRRANRNTATATSPPKPGPRPRNTNRKPTTTDPDSTRPRRAG